MDIGAGDVIVIIGGWFVIGFLVALVLGKIFRAANELDSRRYHPSEHDNVLLEHPAEFRTRDTTPAELEKKDSKRATA